MKIFWLSMKRPTMNTEKATKFQLEIMDTLNPRIKDVGFTKYEWEQVELLFFLKAFHRDIPSATIMALSDFLKAYLKTELPLPIGYLNTIFKSNELRQNLLQLLLYVQQQRENS